MKKLTIIWFLLVLAVAASYFATTETESSTLGIVLAVAKAFAIFWYFVETEYAHPVWKGIAACFVLAFGASMLLLY